MKREAKDERRTWRHVAFYPVPARASNGHELSDVDVHRFCSQSSMPATEVAAQVPFGQIRLRGLNAGLYQSAQVDFRGAQRLPAATSVAGFDD